MGKTAYNLGSGFGDFLGNYVAPAFASAMDIGRDPLGAAAKAATPTLSDFVRGAAGIPSGPPSVTVALPPATPAKGAVPAIAAAPAAAAAKAAAVDPTAGLGGLSFRQLLTLAQTGQAEQRATPKPVTAVDQAGSQLASIYQGQFSNSLKAAGNDSAKQQAAIDAFEKKMLPIALKGNTADAAIFDGTAAPGG